MTVARRRRTLGWIFGVVAVVPLTTHGCGDDGIVRDTMGGGELGVCGDGVLQQDEACDDDNDDPRDDCTNECQLPTCGDAVANNGELCDDGDDDETDSCTAACMPGPAAVVSVAAGEAHTCAVSASSVVRCWGAPGEGRLGQPGYDEHIGDNEPPSDWDPVEVAPDVVALVAGYDHTCALRAGGEVRCWGDNSAGQLGYGHNDSIGDDETPASAGDVPLPGPVQSLAASSAHTCALFEDGTIACWGNNSSGQLGLGNTDRIGDDDMDVITTVPLPEAAVQVVAGESHTCARLASGAVKCWGRQEEGQLGTGEPDDIGDDEPIDSIGNIALGGTAIDIDAYGNFTCAALEGGTVRCWGHNTSGQLGYGDTESRGDRKTPEEIGDVDLIGVAIGVETGRTHTCALLDSGSVRCWGAGVALGLEDDLRAEEPGAVARVGAPVRTLVAGHGHNCAILDSSAVRCWGNNSGSMTGYPEATSRVWRLSDFGDVDVF
ncbi:MAG: hypothetical protein K0V04_45305 [Deltaproteobacteria bacterium]|nr:hypothetical protein [Deltaproteobacteria bacterium]